MNSTKPQLGHRQTLWNGQQPTTYVPAVNDIVEIAGGSRLIVTDIVPSRPANPYLGVLVNGKGKQYKFGPRHNPRFIGTADSSHPALAARQQRVEQVTGLSADYKSLVLKLCDAVENDDYDYAKHFAKVLKTL